MSGNLWHQESKTIERILWSISMQLRSHEYLRTPEAADLLRVSIATLAKWRVKHHGPKYIKIGHIVLYSHADLILWLSDRRLGSRDDE
jgi:hypothetical protein